jgi:5-methylcytosine-specific restriction endonuclease McrA
MRDWRQRNLERERQRERDRYAVRRLNPEFVESERARLNDYAKRNPEKVSQWHRDNPERSRAIKRACQARNRVKYNASSAARYRKNPELWGERVRAWRLRNLPRCAEYAMRRYAAKKANGVFVITDKDLRRLYAGQCAYCKVAPVTQMDHVFPIVRGGRHSIGNLIGSCAFCNQSKSGKLLADWRYRYRNPAIKQVA